MSLFKDLETAAQLLPQTGAPRRAVLARLMAGALAPTALLACGGGGDDTSTSSTTSTSTSTGTSTGTTTGTSTGTSTTTGSTSTGTSTTTGTTTTTSTTTTTTTASNETCSTIPQETAGPYPGDGTNTSNGSTANALLLSGIVRSNIVSSIAGASGTAVGVPLTIKLKLVNSAASCASLAGFAVYLWHADAQGRYSMYSSGVTGENYLRGVQVSDSSGELSFTSIFPGCYDGRWPHIHFEVYSSLAAAVSGRNAVRTSQLALPAEAASAVYATSNYPSSASNLGRVSLSTDNVFSDGVSLQTPTVSGSVSAGYTVTLQVAVSV